MTTESLRVAVAGASGRMGRTLLRSVCEDPTLELAAALAPAGAAVLGLDAGVLAGVPETGIAVCTIEAATDFSVLVDFTRPQGTMAHLEACERAAASMVIGTTGLDAACRERIAGAATRIPIVFAPNMSVGVNLCLHLIEVAARALGDSVDVEIIEAHHRHKVDAPSGTALAMGEAVAGALGKDLSQCAVYAREGHTGEREPGSIGFSSIRGGDIVGEHTVMFAGSGERVEITHRSSERSNYALGALRAARWLDTRPPGLYHMRDVLGLAASASA